MCGRVENGQLGRLEIEITPCRHNYIYIFLVGAAVLFDESTRSVKLNQHTNLHLD